MSLSKPTLNQHDHDHSCLTIGNNAERYFVELAKERGIVVKEATKKQNIYEHWDYLLIKDNQEFKVDIKSMKRISRDDKSFQDEWFWIEFKSVIGQGWIYGKADFLVFERETEFWFISRKKLLKRALELVKKEYVSSSSKAHYKLYTRSGRKDLISLMEYSKIKDLVVRKWKKD